MRIQINLYPKYFNLHLLKTILSEKATVFPPEADPPLEDNPWTKAESSENQTSEDFSPKKFILGT
jgi:hypothetical protein